MFELSRFVACCCRKNGRRVVYSSIHKDEHSLMPGYARYGGDAGERVINTAP